MLRRAGGRGPSDPDCTADPGATTCRSVLGSNEPVVGEGDMPKVRLTSCRIVGRVEALRPWDGPLSLPNAED